MSRGLPLFDAAGTRYVDGPGAFPFAAVAQPTAYEVAESYLREAVLTYTCPGLPKDCMTVQGGLTCGAEAESVQAGGGFTRDDLIRFVDQALLLWPSRP
ncbi:hypothetical protein [Paractinoplanes lichenicola]|uniref:Uncharacterized protein n=1 Tax=Paractinoplanes lichenicola TaxID=2802976 RepID=A0ABS1VZL5_9ACTN|nr:hypothetical protein [Actinoplanes lichenicola]MBL7259934.1 hypothetical protein [Actinoplanes lichenicola]